MYQYIYIHFVVFLCFIFFTIVCYLTVNKVISEILICCRCVLSYTIIRQIEGMDYGLNEYVKLQLMHCIS